MHFPKRTRIVIAASALFLGASVALADDPVSFPECTKAPGPEDVEAAKQSHIIAASRFNLQDWDKAIEFWRQAYGLDCTAHALLVNIANAYEKKGDLPLAREALTKAVDTDRPECKRQQDAFSARARVLARQGFRDEARADLERFRDMGTQTPVGQRCDKQHQTYQ